MKKRGFTLIELMVIMIIVGVCLGIAAPFFLSLLRKERLEKYSRQLALDIKNSRIDAMSLGTRTVVLVVKNTKQDLDADGRLEHYISFLDNNRNGNFEREEEVLYKGDWKDVSVSTNTLTQAGTNTNIGQIIFFPQGTMKEIDDNQEVVLTYRNIPFSYRIILYINGNVEIRRG